MKDHTDRAGTRVLIAMIVFCLFTVLLWVPAYSLWVGPWIYEGTQIGSLEWRKANVFGLWITLIPFAVTMTYCGITMTRAIRRDAADLERKSRARDASYRSTSTIDARRLT